MRMLKKERNHIPCRPNSPIFCHRLTSLGKLLDLSMASACGAISLSAKSRTISRNSSTESTADEAESIDGAASADEEEAALLLVVVVEENRARQLRSQGLADPLLETMSEGTDARLVAVARADARARESMIGTRERARARAFFFSFFDALCLFFFLSLFFCSFGTRSKKREREKKERDDSLLLFVFFFPPRRVKGVLCFALKPNAETRGVSK